MNSNFVFFFCNKKLTFKGLYLCEG